MSAKGCCWDTAVVKSFFSTLKLELALDDNRERRHSTIVYLSPIDYEQQFNAARTLTSVNP
ncbi:hypothetical protein [Vulcanococcus limneticus]|jgi:putative transposase|uniref:hypothetical protein n=1 Tax=Vulcanococcus limneticus TaxID=2170428 RepID=UPI00398C1F50